MSFTINRISQNRKIFWNINNCEQRGFRTRKGALLVLVSPRWVNYALGVPELISAYGMLAASSAVDQESGLLTGDRDVKGCLNQIESKKILYCIALIYQQWVISSPKLRDSACLVFATRGAAS